MPVVISEEGTSKMSSQDIVLVAMPWVSLNRTSIQLGILKTVLDNAGINSGVRSYYLSAMEYFEKINATLPEKERLSIPDYHLIASRYHGLGLGDWIFAVPPFTHGNDEKDQAYLAYLQR